MHDRNSLDLCRFSPDQLQLLEQWMAQEGLWPGAAEPVFPRTRETAAPLTHAQRRIWLMQSLHPEDGIYHLPLAIHLAGPLDLSALQQALDDLAAGHDVLRTRIISKDGNPVQEIIDPRPVFISQTDLRSLSDCAKSRDDHSHLREYARRPLDLRSGLPWRICLQRWAPDEHVLLLVFHHVLCDGASLTLLYSELAARYAARCQGRAMEFPARPVRHLDYALCQQVHPGAETIAGQLEYWKKQLAGLDGVLEMMTDQSRPEMESYEGAVVRRAFPEPLAHRLKDFVRSQEATLFMALLAAFQALLWRYSGQADFVVGTPLSRRTHAELESIPGLFVNTVPLRAALAGQPSLLELVRRVRETVLAAHAHGDAPFEKIVEVVQPPRSMSHHPIFQVMFALEPASLEPVSAGPLRWTPLDFHPGYSKFDLTLSVSERPAKACLEYKTGLFAAATIGRMLENYFALLQTMLDHPSVSIAHLPQLAPAEERCLLVEWNRTEREIPDPACVHQLIQRQARQGPDRVAVEFEERAWTYRELDARAEELAGHLRVRGVGPEVLVGICFEPSFEMLAGILGIMKAGGAYVPLDPAYPRERFLLMLEDAQPALLVTRSGLAAHLAPLRLPKLFLGPSAEVQPASSPAAQPGERHPAQKPAASTPDHLCYVIYTSGSSGRPKGVEITHRSVVNLLASMQSHLEMSASDAMLAVTSISFDIAALELFLPLLAGARIVLASRTMAADAELLRAALSRHAITHMQATPATWRMLVESGWAGHPKLKVLCGGEALPPDLAEQLRARSSAAWNLYGPTETTIWSMLSRMTRTPGHSVSLGRPLANTQVYLLDRQGLPVPWGAPGELCIGGAGLARGYRNRPDLTAQSFVPDPFGLAAGARLYRTGDLARHRPDGTMEFLGRIDHQIKVRGHRIEPGEIESVLCRHPSVREAAVLAHRLQKPEPELVAYVVQDGDDIVPHAALVSYLETRLPRYMVPSVFVTLPALPRTPNGKLDRKSLPAPQRGRPEWLNLPAAPRTTAEERLVAIWREVLGIDRVGIHDSFFDLGGHSLLAMQVVSRASSVLGVKIPLRVLFETPTVAGMSEAIGLPSNDPLPRPANSRSNRDVPDKPAPRKTKQAWTRTPGPIHPSAA